jgi:hypothetical protein
MRAALSYRRQSGADHKPLVRGKLAVDEAAATSSLVLTSRSAAMIEVILPLA